mmetsp:Transcript_10347/g.20547  ORF Transcript_10347/g.20547 Transcript_10347/m.20547 type:complete len:531 (+) Transcript_10347:327-1919(+)
MKDWLTYSGCGFLFLFGNSPGTGSIDLDGFHIRQRHVNFRLRAILIRDRKAFPPLRSIRSQERIGSRLGRPDVQSLPQRLTRLGLGFLIPHLEQLSLFFVPPQEPPASLPHDQHNTPRHQWLLPPPGHEIRRLKIPHQRPKSPIPHLRIGPPAPPAEHVVLRHLHRRLEHRLLGRGMNRFQGRIGNVELDLGGRLRGSEGRSARGGAQGRGAGHGGSFGGGDVFVASRVEVFEFFFFFFFFSVVVVVLFGFVLVVVSFGSLGSISFGASGLAVVLVGIRIGGSILVDDVGGFFGGAETRQTFFPFLGRRGGGGGSGRHGRCGRGLFGGFASTSSFPRRGRSVPRVVVRRGFLRLVSSSLREGILTLLPLVATDDSKLRTEGDPVEVGIVIFEEGMDPRDVVLFVDVAGSVVRFVRGGDVGRGWSMGRAAVDCRRVGVGRRVGIIRISMGRRRRRMVWIRRRRSGRGRDRRGAVGWVAFGRVRRRRMGAGGCVSRRRRWGAGDVAASVGRRMGRRGIRCFERRVVVSRKSP